MRVVLHLHSDQGHFINELFKTTASMVSSVSRVPHLARAIAEKRELALRAVSAVNQTHTSFQRGIITSHGFRAFSSTSKACQQHSTPSTPLPPSAPSLKDAVRTPISVPPPRRRLPSRVPSAGEEDAVYDPLQDPQKVKGFFWAVSIFGAFVGAYCAYTYISYIRDSQQYEMREDKLALHADVSDRWKSEERDFDREVNGQEKMTFMKAKRRRLIREAYGDVLEVSCGTGRNMDLYDTRPYHATEDSSYGRSTRHMITSLTFNDQSPVMMQRAKEKWDQKQKEKRKESRFNGEVNWIAGDARQPGVIPRPAGGYDTIIQSMGICSMTEPVTFLRLLGRLARQPGEAVQNDSPKKFRQQEEEDGQGGRIFLLEHGRGNYEWLNHFLDNTAPMHADRYGCWYNKDIGKIVKDSGLVVERVKQYQLGTVWEVVLRPAPGPLPGENLDPLPLSMVNEEQQQQQPVGRKLGGWLSKVWK